MQKKNMAQTENLRRWRAQKESISNTFNRNLCRIPGARRKSYLSNKEEENIINWIKENRLIKIAITTYAIILYIIKIKQDFKNKKKHVQQQLVQRFLSMIGFSFLKGTLWGNHFQKIILIYSQNSKKNINIPNKFKNKR